jgi:hypothetical protein
LRRNSKYHHLEFDREFVVGGLGDIIVDAGVAFHKSDMDLVYKGSNLLNPSLCFLPSRILDISRLP